MSMRYNEAQVHEASEFLFEATKDYKWFNFQATDIKEEVEVDADEELADLEVRLSPYPVSRSITVTYMNWQEMLSESGASYTFALGAAIIWAVLLKTLYVFGKKTCFNQAGSWLGAPLVKPNAGWYKGEYVLQESSSYLVNSTEEVHPAKAERTPSMMKEDSEEADFGDLASRIFMGVGG